MASDQQDRYRIVRIGLSDHYGVLGCIIPPFLSQINSASVSFGHLQFQDNQNIFIFLKKTPLSLKRRIFKLLRLPI